MTIQHKTFSAEIENDGDGKGCIVISTADVDRDRDRVMPRGAVLDNYQKNPVVMWGHSYDKPTDVIGKTTNLEITDSGIVADFELRPAANDQDPQNVVRLLWDGGWIRTASIGFRPVVAEPNEFGGMDFKEWELLEWSITPVPANAAALRLAAKALDAGDDSAAGDLTAMLVDAVAPAVAAAMKEADPPAPEGKADDTPAVPDTGNDSQDVAPHSTPDADAIEAAQELRLAAILADFVSAVRPYLES